MSRIPPQSTVRLDRAIEQAVADAPDAIAKQDFVEFQAAMAARNISTEGIDPPTMVDALFTHLMPYLRSPSILTADQRRTLLTRLEARTRARGDFAPVVPGGSEALRLELHNLELLRRNRDSLIGG